MFMAYASFYTFDEADSARRRVRSALGDRVRTELRRPSGSYSSPSDVPKERNDDITAAPPSPGLLPGSMLYGAAPAVAQSGIPDILQGGGEDDFAADASDGEYTVRVFGDTKNVEAAAHILRSVGGMNVKMLV